MTRTTETAAPSGSAELKLTETGDSSRIDRLGAFTSALCAVHCLAFALLPGAISALGLGVLFVPALEWSLALLALLMASVALFLGWRRHRAPAVVVAFVGGGSGLVASRLLEEAGVEGWGLPVAVLAALALITGHVLNTRYSRRREAG